MPQQKYWQELYDLKSHASYVEVYLHKTERVDRAINMLLAIASSSSIGAWIIWKEYSLVWATVIASSQVVNAVKPFLPYKARLKALSGLSHDLEELCIQAEMKWFEVAGGGLSAGEINRLQFDFRMKKHRASKRHLGNLALPDNDTYLSIAEERASQHFNNYYKESTNG